MLTIDFKAPQVPFVSWLFMFSSRRPSRHAIQLFLISYFFSEEVSQAWRENVPKVNTEEIPYQLIMVCLVMRCGFRKLLYKLVM